MIDPKTRPVALRVSIPLTLAAVDQMGVVPSKITVFRYATEFQIMLAELAYDNSR